MSTFGKWNKDWPKKCCCPSEKCGEHCNGGLVGGHLYSFESGNRCDRLGQWNTSEYRKPGTFPKLPYLLLRDFGCGSNAGGYVDVVRWKLVENGRNIMLSGVCSSFVPQEEFFWNPNNPESEKSPVVGLNLHKKPTHYAIVDGAAYFDFGNKYYKHVLFGFDEKPFFRLYWKKDDYTFVELMFDSPVKEPVTAIGGALGNMIVCTAKEVYHYLVIKDFVRRKQLPGLTSADFRTYPHGWNLLVRNNKLCFSDKTRGGVFEFDGETMRLSGEREINYFANLDPMTSGRGILVDDGELYQITNRTYRCNATFDLVGTGASSIRHIVANNRFIRFNGYTASLVDRTGAVVGVLPKQAESLRDAHLSGDCYACVRVNGDVSKEPVCHVYRKDEEIETDWESIKRPNLVRMLRNDDVNFLVCGYATSPYVKIYKETIIEREIVVDGEVVDVVEIPHYKHFQTLGGIDALSELLAKEANGELFIGTSQPTAPYLRLWKHDADTDKFIPETLPTFAEDLVDGEYAETLDSREVRDLAYYHNVYYFLTDKELLKRTGDGWVSLLYPMQKPTKPIRHICNMPSGVGNVTGSCFVSTNQFLLAGEDGFLCWTLGAGYLRGTVHEGLKADLSGVNSVAVSHPNAFLGLTPNDANAHNVFCGLDNAPYYRHFKYLFVKDASLGLVRRFFKDVTETFQPIDKPVTHVQTAYLYFNLPGSREAVVNPVVYPDAETNKTWNFSIYNPQIYMMSQGPYQACQLGFLCLVDGRPTYCCLKEKTIANTENIVRDTTYGQTPKTSIRDYFVTFNVEDVLRRLQLNGNDTELGNRFWIDDESGVDGVEFRTLNTNLYPTFETRSAYPPPVIRSHRCDFMGVVDGELKTFVSRPQSNLPHGYNIERVRESANRPIKCADALTLESDAILCILDEAPFVRVYRQGPNDGIPFGLNEWVHHADNYIPVALQYDCFKGCEEKFDDFLGNKYFEDRWCSPKSQKVVYMPFALHDVSTGEIAEALTYIIDYYPETKEYRHNGVKIDTETWKDEHNPLRQCGDKFTKNYMYSSDLDGVRYLKIVDAVKSDWESRVKQISTPPDNVYEFDVTEKVMRYGDDWNQTGWEDETTTRTASSGPLFPNFHADKAVRVGSYNNGAICIVEFDFETGEKTITGISTTDILKSVFADDDWKFQPPDGNDYGYSQAPAVVAVNLLNHLPECISGRDGTFWIGSFTATLDKDFQQEVSYWYPTKRREVVFMIGVNDGNIVAKIFLDRTCQAYPEWEPNNEYDRIEFTAYAYPSNGGVYYRECKYKDSGMGGSPFSDVYKTWADDVICQASMGFVDGVITESGLKQWDESRTSTPVPEGEYVWLGRKVVCVDDEGNPMANRIPKAEKHRIEDLPDVGEPIFLIDLQYGWGIVGDHEYYYKLCSLPDPVLI